MPDALAASFTTAETVTVALIVLLALVVAAMAFRAWRLSRISPEERERQRRAALVSRGKMGDATVVEFRGDHLFYSYAVRGVAYTASQDVSALKPYLPADLSALMAHILVKYDPRNPANSIVLAEDWSGLRVNQARD